MIETRFKHLNKTTVFKFDDDGDGVCYDVDYHDDGLPRKYNTLYKLLLEGQKSQLVI